MTHSTELSKNAKSAKSTGLTKCSPLRNPLILALDLDDESKAWEIVEQTAGLVGGIKIGPRLMLRYGPHFLKKIVAQAPVFLDMKFFDIPSTMVSAVRSAFDLGVSLVTVHAQAGVVALEELAKLEAEYKKTQDVEVLAVTILTSFEEKTLPAILKTQSIEQHVIDLTQLVTNSGLNGLVCSPHELKALSKFNNLYLVTPGIRTNSDTKGDQKRTMSPQEAMAAGATAIVVGRPILEATSPQKVCLSILETLALKQSQEKANP